MNVKDGHRTTAQTALMPAPHGKTYPTSCDVDPLPPDSKSSQFSWTSYIHQMNQVNSRNGSVMTTAP